MREKLKKLAPDFLIEWYKSIRYGSITLLFSIFRMVPIKKNRIVLMNVWGYGDNVKYVAQQLLDSDAELYFICNHPEHKAIPAKIHARRTNTPGAIYALATAKVWIGSNRMEPYIKKRKNQFYIQLWHGGLALKKIEGDCAEHLGSTYIKNAKRDSAMTNLYVSNGSFCTAMYQRAFWFQGEILECGSPRMDLLLSADSVCRQKIKSKLGLTETDRIAVYAPTYHDGMDFTVYALSYEKIKNALERKFGGSFTMITRLHPLVRQMSALLHLPDDVIDAGDFDDLYELMAVSDVLITDYSNTMFEFAQQKKPVFLFAKDIESYEKDRGMYFPHDTLPFPIAKSNEELIDNIINYEEEKEAEKVFKFLENAGIHESGHAADTVAKRALKELSR